MQDVSKPVVVVVGDRFAEFASLTDVLTVSDLAALFESAPDAQQLPAQVVVGQGVSESWLAYLQTAVDDRGGHVKFFDEERLKDRPGRHQCHKWERNNILITRPRQLSETLFSTTLSIDDGCEIMADHVTGLHVQGMVLVEAARQVFLTVTERFLLGWTWPKKH